MGIAGVEGFVVIAFFIGLFIILWVRNVISNVTGLKDGSKGLMFATIGFFILAWLLFLVGVYFFEG